MKNPVIRHLFLFLIFCNTTFGGVFTNFVLQNPTAVSDGKKLLIYPLTSNNWDKATTRVDHYTNGVLAKTDVVYQQLSGTYQYPLGRIAFAASMPEYSTQRWDVITGAPPAFIFEYEQTKLITNSGNITNWMKYSITNGHLGIAIIDPNSLNSTNKYPVAGIMAANGTWNMTNSFLYQNEDEQFQNSFTNCATNITQRIIDNGPLRVQIETILGFRRTGSWAQHTSGPGYLTNLVTLDAYRYRVRIKDSYDTLFRVFFDVSQALSHFNQFRMRESDAMNTGGVRLWQKTTNAAGVWPTSNGATGTDNKWDVTTNTSITPFYANTSSNATGINFQTMYGAGHIGGVGSYDMGDWIVFVETNSAANTPLWGMIQGDMAEEYQSYPAGWAPYNSSTNFQNLAQGRFGFFLGLFHRAPNQGSLIDSNHIRNWCVFVGTNGMLQTRPDPWFWEANDEYADETAFSSADIADANFDLNVFASKEWGYTLLEKAWITNVNYAIKIGSTYGLALSNTLYTTDSGFRDLTAFWGNDLDATNFISSQLLQSSNQLYSYLNGDGTAPNAFNFLQGGQRMIRQAVTLEQNLWRTPRDSVRDSEVIFYLLTWAKLLFHRGFYPLDQYLEGSNRGVSLGTENMPYQVQGARRLYSCMFYPFFTNGLYTVGFMTNDVVSTTESLISGGIHPSSPHYVGASLPVLAYAIQGLQKLGFDPMIYPTASNNLAQAMEFVLSFITSSDPRFQNKQANIVAFAHGDWEPPIAYADYASIWRTNNPTLQKRLVGAWQRGGSVYLSFYLDSILAAIPSAISNSPDLHSINFLGYHSHYRDLEDTTALWLLNGRRARDHIAGGSIEAGETCIWALGNLISGEYGFYGYVNDPVAVWEHNTIMREPLHPTWNTVNSISEILSEWNDSTNRNYVSFQRSWWADAASTNNLPNTNNTDCGWTRDVKVLQYETNFPVFYFTDTFTGNTAISNRIMIRKLTGTGDVVIGSTTFSPTKTTRFSSQLPNTDSITNLAAGLHKIQTTGQVFTTHITQGTDTDLWLWQNTPTDVSVGSHRQQIPDSIANFALGGAAYLLQHEFRIRASNGFNSIILPRGKVTVPPTVTTNGDGTTIFIALTNSGWYRLSNNIAEFSRTASNIAATVFSGTSQFITTNGISISGGPTEVIIKRNTSTTNVSIAASGVLGTRTITNVSLKYPIVVATDGSRNLAIKFARQ